jgi:hypothetical protein
MLRRAADLLSLAARRAAKSWLAALSLPIYGIAFLALGLALAPLGKVGSFILGFVGAAFCGGYLSLLASGVAGEPLRWVDLKNGLRAIWDVVSVLFILWIASMVLEPILAGMGSRGPALRGVIALAEAVFLNAVPEVLYIARERSLAAIKASASFVMENPVAWFVPNLLLAAIFFGATGQLTFTSPGELLVRLSDLASVMGVFGIVAGPPYWKIPLLIVFVHFAMVFRGLLFQELTTGSGRMREFQRRMGRA